VDTQLEIFQNATPVILALVAFGALILLFAFIMALRARKAKTKIGPARLIGAAAVIEVVKADKAWVRIEGELREVSSDTELGLYEGVVVEAIDGAKLRVVPQAAQEK